MSKLAMKRVEVFGLKSHRKAILEALQRFGVIEPFATDLSDEGFTKTDTLASSAAFLKAQNTLESALEVLSRYAPEDLPLLSVLEGKKTLSVEQYYRTVDNSDRAVMIAREINDADRRISELKAEIAGHETEITALMPWQSLDIPMSFKGTRKTVMHLGTLPDKYDLETLITEYNNGIIANKGVTDDPMLAAEFKILSSEPGISCIVVFSRRETAREVETVLRSMGVSKPSFVVDQTPKEAVDGLNCKIAICREEIEKLTERIVYLAKHRDLLRFMVDYYEMRIEKYKVLGGLNQRKKFFVLEGYIPEKYAEAVSEELTRKYSAAVEVFDPAEDDQPPVLLHNNAFAEPVETVLETYSMPLKHEIDPTFIMSLFYYFLFGLMLSDAGYGLLMVIGCGFCLLRYKDMAPGLKKSLTMFFYCGISTFFWGVMFGGYFGDAIQVISGTFFNNTVAIPPLWFEPIRDPMRMLIFSFAVGIVHVFAGLAIKLYQLVKAGDVKSAIYDVVFWYLLVGGAVVYLLSMAMFTEMAGIKFILPKAAGTVAAVCAGIGAVGIILFGGRASKNPGKRIAKGLYELYGVTGYLSDVLSYSRLLALGLATGVIAQVFNQMGSMFGGGIVGAIIFTVVFIIGHSLNMAINLLGAYVHTNRLQFVEFFGKFFEGGGEKFKPFSANTKYYRFKEE